MIQFIDITDKNGGKVINGSKPMIHWLPGPCSINLYYTKTLWVLSDQMELLIQLPTGQNIFYIYDTTKADSVSLDSIDAKQWANDIDNYLVKEVRLTGTQLNGLYIYQVILICKSTDIGEFIEDIKIGGQVFSVGAEFYMENEMLKINLQNMGVEVPNQVIKAFYPTDLQENHIDWITLNRKRRELLSNYMDIIGCKGNYKSLLCSLKWFEYGDLVEMREMWKHDTEDGEKLADRPIREILTSRIKDSMVTYQKTTYFMLRNLTSKLTYDENGWHTEKVPGTDTDKDGFTTGKITVDSLRVQDIPAHGGTVKDGKVIYSITKGAPKRDYGSTDQEGLDGTYPYDIVKWEEDEMRMKMTLLGNFFETYFMPIHLDLIYSVVEDINFYDNIADDFYAASGIEEINFTNTGDFNIDPTPPDPDKPDGDDMIEPGKYRLNEHDVWGWAGLSDSGVPIVPFCSDPEKVVNGTDGVVGITTDNPFDANADLATDYTTYFGVTSQNFHGIGSIVDLTAKFDEPITEGRLITNINNKLEERRSKIDNKDSIRLQFLCQYPGKFYLYFTFIGQSQKRYTKKVDIEILDNVTPILEFYKLVYSPIKHIEGDPVKLLEVEEINYPDIPASGGTVKEGLFKYRIKETNDLEINPFDIDYLGPNRNMFSREIVDGPNFQSLPTTEISIKYPDIPASGGTVKEGDLKLVLREENTYDLYNPAPPANPNKYRYSQFIPVYPVKDRIYEDQPILSTLTTFAGNPVDLTWLRNNLQIYDFESLKVLLQTEHPKFWIRLAIEQILGDTDDPEHSDLEATMTVDDIPASGGTVKEGDVKYQKNQRPEPKLVYIQFLPKDPTKDSDIGPGDMTDKIKELWAQYVFTRQLYIPEYHQAVLLKPTDKVPDVYPIIVVPKIDITDSGGIVHRVDYSHLTNVQFKWTFKSWSTLKIIGSLSDNIMEPFIGSPYNTKIPIGFIDVTFSWRWGNDTKTVKAKTPLRIASVASDTDYRSYNRLPVMSLQAFGSKKI